MKLIKNENNCFFVIFTMTIYFISGWLMENPLTFADSALIGLAVMVSQINHQLSLKVE
jgi:hypothetical protein